MASWHQMKARKRAGKSFTLQHPTQWRVLHDPYGQPASIMAFSMEHAARSWLARTVARGEHSHYLLEPAYVTNARRALAEQGDVYC